MIDVVAVEEFTKGRLHRDAPETRRQLDVALAALRHYCGWHVMPVVDTTLVLDGPGGKLLTLPTLNLRQVDWVVEDGVAIDPGDITWAANGRIVKRDGRRWSDRMSGVTVSFRHGFDSLPDLETVMLTWIDRGGLAQEQLGTGGVRVVGPFQYDTATKVVTTVFNEIERGIIDCYRLEKPA
jgi:hypothetical protein